MVVSEGFEPSTPESKSGVLPLHHETSRLVRQPGVEPRHTEWKSVTLPIELLAHEIHHKLNMPLLQDEKCYFEIDCFNSVYHTGGALNHVANGLSYT